jgi:murein DD-endopeptidase MepM/ murein hydrolase activator NlpD
MPESDPASPFGRPSRTRPHKQVFHGISPRRFYTVFTVLVATNVVSLVGLLMAPDIAALVNGQSEQVLSAYQDRIAELRIEVDRLHSRHYAQTGDINLQLQEIAQQQEVLSEQQQYVKVLAGKAAELGLATAALPESAIDAQSAALVTADRPVAEQADAAEADVSQMLEESRLALANLSHSANASTTAIVSELKKLGITPVLPSDDEGVGGPFIPAVADGPDATGMVDDANAVMAALSRFKAARAAIDDVPVHKPLSGALRMTSGFGNRPDPFTGRLAFHAGLDFGEPRGTTVLSAGAGRISFVGQRSGYGNTVEIDHGNGIVSRYGHLSAFLVKEGQTVSVGTPVATVGSTGRSAGPHLHFEVRRDNRAVNPLGFLKAGKVLEKYLAG